MIETQVRVEPGDHLVHFYGGDDDLVGAVTAYLGDGLCADETVIVVATDTHTAAFEAALGARGIDVAEARARGAFVSFDASLTLSKLFAGGEMDADAFDTVVGGIVHDASRSGRPVRAYGEMVARLWDDGNVAAAIELESLWNDLGRRASFSLFCAYPAQSVAGEDQADALHQVCHLHSAIVGPNFSNDTVDLHWTEEVRAFGNVLRAPRDARRFIVETLERWGREDLLDDAALVVTELATNAVVHARSDFIVALSSDGGRVRVEVRDANPAVPIVRDTAGTTGTSGRGLLLIAALADRWGTQLTGDGKIVWAEFRRGGADRSHTDTPALIVR
jgi:anti-sigma regulatory factor (Ser/Thr protein kinase)